MHLRRLAPWAVSAGLLIYVFGWLTDWDALVRATEDANLPLFVAFTFLDKMIFFLFWSALQVTAIRRLVGPLSIRSLLALRGGSELLRSVSNPLADAAFLVGLAHTTGGSPARVIVGASVPGMVHGIVLLIQITLVLFLLTGGPFANRDVAITVLTGWAVVVGIVVALRTALTSRSGRLARLRAFLETVEFRAFAPMLGWFFVLAFLDVLVQWFATRAFGVPIDFVSLAARIPILYWAFLIPSFGNFGTRELVWAALFAEYAARDVLIAYAFATNTLFLLFNVLIGVVFLPRALVLIRDVRAARRAGPEAPDER